MMISRFRSHILIFALPLCFLTVGLFGCRPGAGGSGGETEEAETEGEEDAPGAPDESDDEVADA